MKKDQKLDKQARVHAAFWAGVTRARKGLVQGGGRNELGAELGHLQHGSDAEQAEWRGLVMFWEFTSKRTMTTLEGLMQDEGLTMTDFLDKLEEIESPSADAELDALPSPALAAV